MNKLLRLEIMIRMVFEKDEFNKLRLPAHFITGKKFIPEP